MLTQSNAGQATGPSADREFVNYGAGASVLERLPNGEYAWLRPEPERCATCGGPLTQWGARGSPCEFGHPLHQEQPADDECVSLTQRGQDLLNRWRAERWLFGVEVS